MTLGVFFAAWYALWAILVGIGGGQAIIDLVMPLHFLDNMYKVSTFSFSNAVVLVVLAFIGSYIFGWLFAALWNWMKVK